MLYPVALKQAQSELYSSKPEKKAFRSSWLHFLEGHHGLGRGFSAILFGLQRSVNFLLSPALSHFGYDALLVRLQRVDQRLIAGLFVASGPQHHFSEDRSKIDAFRCKRVGEFSTIRGIGLRGDDAMRFQLAQPIGQYICGDMLVRRQEFLIGLEATYHHVADN
jgi:hypothetical protein